MKYITFYGLSPAIRSDWDDLKTPASQHFGTDEGSLFC